MTSDHLPAPIRRRLEGRHTPDVQPERPRPEASPTTEAERQACSRSWNLRLAQAGHRVGRPFVTVADPERVPRELEDLRFPRRDETHHSVRITSAAGTRYADLKSDAAMIAAALDSDGDLDRFRRAMRRGRPTPETIATRGALAARARQLLDMGANIGAIADVLGCGREAVSTLVGRAGTVPSRAPKTR